LRAVGFGVRFALRVGVDVTSDAAILRWAREHDYILVCHDRHKDRKTRLELYPEIYHNGGRIICVGGGPDQDPLVALGRILVHLDEWRDFFAQNDGIVVVHKTGMNVTPSYELYARVQGELDMERATGRRVIRPSRQRRGTRRQEPSAQTRMNI
jgi:hypothetical protein